MFLTKADISILLVGHVVEAKNLQTVKCFVRN